MNMPDPFSHYMPNKQTMIDSFISHITTHNQTINNTAPIQPNNDTQPTNENPCSIIQMRLARGEIPIE
jgi:hypothetical protein